MTRGKKIYFKFLFKIFEMDSGEKTDELNLENDKNIMKHLD